MDEGDGSSNSGAGAGANSSAVTRAIAGDRCVVAFVYVCIELRGASLCLFVVYPSFLVYLSPYVSM